jgi:hypothetical protein
MDTPFGPSQNERHVPVPLTGLSGSPSGEVVINIDDAINVANDSQNGNESPAIIVESAPESKY